ncbi:MAG: hypothetical protein ACFFBD_06855 [Candidatus Hodarchaeota archaeon]
MSDFKFPLKEDVTKSYTQIERLNYERNGEHTKSDDNSDEYPVEIGPVTVYTTEKFAKLLSHPVHLIKVLQDEDTLLILGTFDVDERKHYCQRVSVVAFKNQRQRFQLAIFHDLFSPNYYAQQLEGKKDEEWRDWVIP